MKHGTYGGFTAGCRCDACRNARNAYTREWRRRNPEKVRAARRLSAARNPDAGRAQRAAWKSAHFAYDRDRERARKQRRASETAAGSTQSRRRWSLADDATCVRRDLAAIEVAHLLGRTYAAVVRRRYCLSRAGRVAPNSAPASGDVITTEEWLVKYVDSVPPPTAELVERVAAILGLQVVATS